LRDLEDLSYEEVAEVLEVSVGTVKSRILRGRRMLKDILDPLVHAQPISVAHQALTPIAPPAAGLDLTASAAALVSVRSQRSTS
jgi:hypothetical protein